MQSFDIVHSTVEYWWGEQHYLARIDMKQNVKNQHYHKVCGSGVIVAGNCLVDADAHRQAQIRKEFYTPNDFACNKLIESLFSFCTTEQIEKGIEEGLAKSNVSDLAASHVSNLFFLIELSSAEYLWNASQ